MWTCHSKSLNNRINNLYERVLRIVKQNKKSDFETLLKNNKSTTFHVKNLHYLVTEIYEVKNNIFPGIMRDIFDFQENGKLQLKEWYPSCFKEHENNIVWKKTISNLEAKIWPLLPEELCLCKFFKID